MVEKIVPTATYAGNRAAYVTAYLESRNFNADQFIKNRTYHVSVSNLKGSRMFFSLTHEELGIETQIQDDGWVTVYSKEAKVFNRRPLNKRTVNKLWHAIIRYGADEIVG